MTVRPQAIVETRSVLLVPDADLVIYLRTGEVLHARLVEPLKRGGDAVTVRLWGCTSRRVIRLRDVRRADAARVKRWKDAKAIADRQAAQARRCGP